MERPDRVVVIHYSCQSFYDIKDGASPRITSIAVRNLESGQTTSFSIHQKAEEDGLTPNQLEPHYNRLEGLMLADFYTYVSGHAKHRWLHWNMRDSNFGFQAIAHRYKVLKNGLHVADDRGPVEIPEDKLINLSDVLADKYGPRYIGDPRLKRLLERNRMGHKDFLDGAQEALAFDSGEYVKLHQSTLRKVDILAHIGQKAYDGTLKTDATWLEQHGGVVQALADAITETPWIIIALAVATIGGAIVGIIPPIHDFLAHVFHLGAATSRA
jgi:hypothetical protein